MVEIVLHYASESDIPAVLEVERAMEKILGKSPKDYGVNLNRRCASAHKTPDYIDEVIGESPADVRGVILGRQPAAPPAIDANCTEPVITYLTDGKGNPEQVYASLNVPSGVACMTAPPWPESMALALLKVASVKEERLKDPIHAFQSNNRKAVLNTDERYKGKSTEEADKIFKEREAAKQKK